MPCRQNRSALDAQQITEMMKGIQAPGAVVRSVHFVTSEVQEVYNSVNNGAFSCITSLEMEKSPRGTLSTVAEEKSLDSSRLNSARLSKETPRSARDVPESARSSASARIPESGRSAKSEVPNSSRSNAPVSSRSNNPATMETGRTYMDTARVHTALAALGAEKQALLAKLQQIDAALETGEKKKASQSRPKK